MFPILFHFKGWWIFPETVIPTFFFMTMLAGLVATFYLYFRAPKLGFSQVIILDVGMLGIAFGIIGARLFHVFFERWDFYRDDLWRIFDLWRGGVVSYGAFILGGIALITYLLWRRVSLLKYLDFIALAGPICVFFVRVGCLGAGCCHGKPTDFFLHIVFKHLPDIEGQPNYSGVPLHPTQIYEMLYAIGIFIFLNLYYKSRKFDGQIFFLFFILYAFCRFFQEFLRGDRDRGLYFNDLLSTGQIVSLGIFALCSLFYFYLRRRSKTSL